MIKINLGDVVASQSHPYSASYLSTVIMGEHLMLPPLMVVIEILTNANDEYSEENGLMISSKDNLNCKCTWFSSKTNQYEESWFPSKSNPNLNKNEFLIKIKHVKYFLWLVIIGLIIAIGAKNDSHKETNYSKIKTTTNKSKKAKRKRIRSIHKDDLKIKQEDSNELLPKKDSGSINPERTEIILPIDTTKIND